MNDLPPSNRSDDKAPPNAVTGTVPRVRRLGVVALLVLALLVPACTPEEIEASFERIAVSFEQGGVERGLADAIVVVEYAIPVVGMRLGSALGP